MNDNTLKQSLEEIRDSSRAITNTLDNLSKVSHKNIRRIRLELMKALFDLRDAIEEIYEVEPGLKPKDFDLDKEERILYKQFEARKLEMEGKFEKAAKIYNELLKYPEAQFIKESFQAGLYRCNKI